MDALSRALEMGFTYAKTVLVDEFEFSPEFRVCCEDNACGNYNASYSCPPLCGTVDEMIAKTKKYKYGFLICTACDGVDAYDWEQADMIKADHIQRQNLLMKELLDTGALPQDGLPIYAGACSLCETCKAKEGKPCVMPDKVACCMSAYCINVTVLSEKAGIPISWDGDQISFYSMYLYN